MGELPVGREREAREPVDVAGRIGHLEVAPSSVSYGSAAESSSLTTRSNTSDAGPGVPTSASLLPDAVGATSLPSDRSAAPRFDAAGRRCARTTTPVKSGSVESPGAVAATVKRSRSVAPW
jgi:hypothetical protein